MSGDPNIPSNSSSHHSEAAFSASSRLPRFKQQLACYFDDFQTPIGGMLNLAIAVLILLSAAIFVLQTYPLPPVWQSILTVVDMGILFVFVVEYGLRLWCADHKLKFVFSLYSLLDLLAIVPFLFGFVDIRFIRLFRWFRILRLFRFLEQKVWLKRVQTEDGIIFARILFTLFSIIFVYSGLIYQVEHAANPDKFSDFIDAFYFAVVTMTTVGFGDVTPTSQAGRALTVLMILTGVALIPWQLGELIRHLIKVTNQVRVACPRCRLSLHDKDAMYCKLCGAELPRSQPD